MLYDTSISFEVSKMSPLWAYMSVISVKLLSPEPAVLKLYPLYTRHIQT